MIWAGIIGVGLILIVVFVAVMLVTISNNYKPRAASKSYSVHPSTWTITMMTDEFVVKAKKIFKLDRCDRGYGPIYNVYELEDGRILFSRQRYASGTMEDAGYRYYNSLNDFLNNLDALRYFGEYCEEDNCYFIRACKRKWDVKPKHQS